MNKSTKFTKEYKNKLSGKVKELTEYLQLKTGYCIAMTVEFDKSIGYVYRLRVSVDDFETYGTIMISSINKVKLLQELKLQVPKLNFNDKRRVYYSRKNTTGTSSIWCCNCENELAANNFHRNIHTPLFSKRGGYAYLCFNCANERAAEIMKVNGFHAAIIFLSALYDRAYIKSLTDDIADMNIAVVEKFGLYFKRLNLVPSLKRKEKTFSDSDMFIEETESNILF